jgi:hypothetical protein
MALPNTVILEEPWEIEPRLVGFGLHKVGLLRVRDLAVGAAADVTNFFCANSAGTFSYHYGVFGLRDQFVGRLWLLDRPGGIEVIRNVKTNMLIGFMNVDIACDDINEPQPRSDRGAGTERACQWNLFGNLPLVAERKEGLWNFYYLMVAENGAAELSCPIVEDTKIVGFVERIYLSDGSDIEPIRRLADDDATAEQFDPQVTRKRA